MFKKNDEVIKITVLNWDDYQNKKGGDWFKMYHDVVYSNSVSKLPPYVKWLFVCVLCECSRRSQGSVEFILSSFSRRAELKPSWCRVGFKLMSERSLIATVSDDFGVPRLDKIRLDKDKIRGETKISVIETAPQLSAPQNNSPYNSTFLFIKTYCTVYKERYKTNPVIDGKTQGLVKNLLKATSLEHLSALIQVYLQMNDKWFVTKHHDFVTFTQNLNMIQVAMSNGKETPKEGVMDWDKFWADQDKKEGGGNGQKVLRDPS